MSADATAVAAPSEFDRSGHIPIDYSPAWHGARTLALALGIGGFGLFLARDAAPWDWLFVPAFFLAANAIEWAFHRGPMHRLVGPRIFYKNHALLHHRAFHHDSMELRLDGLRDLGLVMMPWYTMLLLFVLASPIALVAGLLRGPAVAGMFFFTAAMYFLLYESMHALYHMPRAVLRRLRLVGPAFGALRAHHTHHHRLDRMAHVNFNVTLPIMDYLLGTREAPSEPTEETESSRFASG